MFYRRESHRQRSNSEEGVSTHHDNQKRTTGSRLISYSSVHVIVACSLLWTMTLRRSFLLQISSNQYSHRILEEPGSDHLSVRYSLISFGSYHKNATAVAATSAAATTTSRDTSLNISLQVTDSLASMNLPLWMKEYFEWHRQQLQTLNETNWKQRQYLILACSREDEECGGVADRLKPLPLVLAVAQKTKRVLFIRWTRPFPLEEFLTPVHLNWSVPEWLNPQLQNLSKHFAIQQRLDPDATTSTTTDKEEEVNHLDYQKTKGSKNLVKKMRLYRKVVVWEARVQDIFGGCALYEQLVTDTVNATQWKDKKRWNPMSGWHLYKDMYRDLFRALFAPSPPIQELLQQKMDSAGLVPGRYTAAHYRAFYAIENQKQTKSENTLKRFAVHAVECAAALSPGVPIYFASDSKVAIDTIREYAKASGSPASPSIITFSNESEMEAIHLDKPTNRKTQPPDYYATFVDLLTMSNARCLTYGQGGFGLFAALMSHDANCTLQHSRKKRLQNCTEAIEENRNAEES